MLWGMQPAQLDGAKAYLVTGSGSECRAGRSMASQWNGPKRWAWMCEAYDLREMCGASWKALQDPMVLIC